VHHYDPENKQQSMKYRHKESPQSLNKLKKKFKTVQNENHAILQNDNATPHTSARTREAIERLGFPLLPHPPYSPDLAPSDFHLFRQGTSTEPTFWVR
jgi:transposase